MTRLDRHREALNLCTYCPKLCTFACPVSNAEKQEAVTPWAKMTLANLLYKGVLPVDGVHSEPLLHCLACRLCTSYCKHEVDVGQVLTDARAELIDRGVIHPEAARLRDTWEQHDNRYGLNLGETLREMLGPERFVEEAQVVYFPGAETIAERPGEIHAAFSLFDSLSMDYVACYGGQQLDAGLSLYRAGFRADFALRAERLAHQLLRYKLIVTSSPESLYTLTALFLELGINLTGRVKHVLDLVWPLARGRAFGPPPAGDPTLHDPSYAVRYLNQADLPRSIVRALYGLDPIEMVYSRRSAYSSGSLPPYAVSHPGRAQDIARERLRQAAEVGAGRLLTGAPAAAALLEGQRRATDPEVSTLTELLEHCLTRI